MLAKIVHPHFALMFTRHQQEMFKTHLTNSRTLAGDLMLIQRFTLNTVAHGETTVGAVIGAQIRKIERHVKAHRVAKTLAGEALRALGHRFKVRAGCRRKQGHQIFARQMFGC